MKFGLKVNELDLCRGGPTALGAALRRTTSWDGPLEGLQQELDRTRVALLKHITLLEDLESENEKRLTAIDDRITILQAAICSASGADRETLQPAVERLGNLLVSRSILNRIGPQIAAARHTHRALIDQIDLCTSIAPPLT
jgi:hypothetical protein